MISKKYLLITLCLPIIPIATSISCTKANSSSISRTFHVLQYEPLLNSDVKKFVGNTYSFSLVINYGVASTSSTGAVGTYYKGTFVDYITNSNGDIFQYNPNATGPNDWYSKSLNLYASSPILEFTITLNQTEVRPY